MVSIILPSIRSKNLDICIRKLYESQYGEFEIITITDGNDGPTEAICRGEAKARGEYLFRINDQVELTPGGLMKMVAFSKKHNDRIIVDQKTFPVSPLKYYGKTFSPYPFIHRNLSDELGGYHLPEFKAFYADPDLSMRAYKAGIPIIKCPGVAVKRDCRMTYEGHKENVSKYYKNDMINFYTKWGVNGFKEIAPGKKSWLWCRFLELLPY